MIHFDSEISVGQLNGATKQNNPQLFGNAQSKR